jgi:hypothetical protein
MIAAMRNALAVLALVTLAACSSSGNDRANVIQPEIGVEQVVGPAQLNYPTGQIDIEYRFRIANRSSEPITLRRIELRSVSGGGAYQLRPDFYPFNKTIAPNAFEDVTLWAKAYAYGRTLRENEPVSMRGTAFFDSPAGSFHQVFLREIPQLGSGE